MQLVSAGAGIKEGWMMKKRLVSLGVILVLTFVCCFGGFALATQDIRNTDVSIYPGGSDKWIPGFSSGARKYTAGISGVHRITKFTHVPEISGTYINQLYSAIYRDNTGNRVSDGYVIFTGAARKLIPYKSGYGGEGWGYCLKIQSAGDTINSFHIEGSWAPDNE